MDVDGVMSILPPRPPRALRPPQGPPDQGHFQGPRALGQGALCPDFLDRKGLSYQFMLDVGALTPVTCAPKPGPGVDHSFSSQELPAWPLQVPPGLVRGSWHRGPSPGPPHAQLPALLGEDPSLAWH